jgi:hypothetical protein
MSGLSPRCGLFARSEGAGTVSGRLEGAIDDMKLIRAETTFEGDAAGQYEVREIDRETIVLIRASDAYLARLLQQLLIDNLTGHIIDDLEESRGLIEAKREIVAIGPDHVHYKRR